MWKSADLSQNGQDERTKEGHVSDVRMMLLRKRWMRRSQQNHDKGDWLLMHIQADRLVDAAIRRYETNVAIPSVLSLSYGDDTIIATEQRLSELYPIVVWRVVDCTYEHVPLCLDKREDRSDSPCYTQRTSVLTAFSSNTCCMTTATHCYSTPHTSLSPCYPAATWPATDRLKVIIRFKMI